MILNESGINKVVEYIGEEFCKYVHINDRHLMLGIFNDEDKVKLEDIGIKLNNIGGGLHEVILEKAEIDSTEIENIDPEQPIQPGMDDKDIKQLANMLLPILRQAFPTKDEVNDIIHQLQSQAIDPEEMVDGLKMQIRRINKQSRANDEVG